MDVVCVCLAWNSKAETHWYVFLQCRLPITVCETKVFVFCLCFLVSVCCLHLYSSFNLYCQVLCAVCSVDCG